MSPPPFRGFGPLKTPADLLDKLRFDFERLKAEPLNVFATFDFFVTAFHMLDWIHGNDSVSKGNELAGSPLLQLCNHLASGAKHFVATDPRHRSVSDVQRKHDVWGGAWGNSWGSAWQRDEVVVELTGAAADLYGPRVNIVTLAERVLAHWESDQRLTRSAN
jgi:hypothetical protein